MKDLLNLFDEDNSIREFNFIIFVVSLVIIARNYQLFSHSVNVHNI